MKLIVVTIARVFAVAAILGWSVTAHAQTARTVSLPSPEATSETYLERPAVRVTAPAGDRGRIVLIEGVAFHQGVAEFDVAGEVMVGAPSDTRAFVGLAFAVTDPEHYEAFYMRATNGRADAQLRRNRAVQYIAEPEFTWQRLRAERTGEFESYADLGPGEWVHMRIEVDEARARLFINGAAQPALTVPRLKSEGVGGSGIALWVGPGSIGLFHNLTVTPVD